MNIVNIGQSYAIYFCFLLPQRGEIQLTARNSTPKGGENGGKCVTLWLL